MKRTPLRRKTPLRASRARNRTTKPPRTKYASRPRATAYMLFVKSLPCALRDNGDAVALEVYGPDEHPFWWINAPITSCSGPTEADHMGQRALSRKAPDSTCGPLCTQHHRERTDHTGAFKHFTQADMRAFCADVVAYTQSRARARGIEIPS